MKKVLFFFMLIKHEISFFFIKASTMCVVSWVKNVHNVHIKIRYDLSFSAKKLKAKFSTKCCFQTKQKADQGLIHRGENIKLNV